MKKAKPVSPPKTIEPKKSSFWDDDEPTEETKPVPAPIVHTNIPDATPTSKRERNAPEPVKLLPVSAPSPEGFFSLQCGEDRVLIIRPIQGHNSDWSELLCYHHRMQITMHLKRVDLSPKHHVDAAIQFLQSVK